MEINKLKKIKFYLIIATIFVGVFTIIFGMSYAFFSTTDNSKEYIVYSGNLKVDFLKNGNAINITGIPQTDTQGLASNNNVYTFDVKNNGSINAKYQVRLELDNNSTVPIEYIRMAYKKGNGSYSNPVSLNDLPSNLVFTTNNLIEPTSIDTLSLKLWIDISAPNDIQGKIFKARIVVDAIQETADSYQIDTKPIIVLNKLNDNTDINLQVNDTFTDPGVLEVKDDKDILSLSDVTTTYEYFDGTNTTTVNGVDTTQAGIYYINYTVTDSNTNTTTITRVVTVNATSTLPTIALNGDNPLSVNQNQTFTDPGVTVDTNNRVVTIGEVKTSVLGTYQLRYIVIDPNGNMNSIVRSVEVEEPAPSEPLSDMILAKNTPITTAPTLTKTSYAAGESGLYSMTTTNGFGGEGDTTYYFRGDVDSNIVEFGTDSNDNPLIWRIIRINEDGTVRLILDQGINSNEKYAFNSIRSAYTYMYYSNSGNYIKKTVNDWYDSTIGNNSIYASKVVTGNYFCEAAKVNSSSSYTSGSATMAEYNSYTPDLKCETDGNDKGYVSASAGLITYDEVVLAGGYYGKSNLSYYLYKTATDGVVNNHDWWTMSPAGYYYYAYAWHVISTGYPRNNEVRNTSAVRPVINLKADTLATYDETTGHYIVE